jgi:AraC-like DNA-binding protein
VVDKEAFITNDGLYYEINTTTPPAELREDNYSYVLFDAKIFDSVNFFTSLDIPHFLIKDAPAIAQTIENIIAEEMNPEFGKERLLQNFGERLCMEIVRYILRNRLFVEQLATNVTYFKDPRLVAIFNYIKANLAGDLSNKQLAYVAGVSEDYLGQYFKILTGINPQDYIEYQRMEEAINLLRTTKKSIRDVAKLVGYRGTAYFCRRFKMVYGIPAGKMRRRETLININQN